MSTIAFNWFGGNPPSQDVYTTRRGESRYHTLRYWDGKDWWSVEWSGRRGGKPFTWPKGSRTRKPTSKYGQIDFHIRKINSHLGAIQWGAPYRVYDDKEVLAYLVNTGRLPTDWRKAYQEEMRAKLGVRHDNAARNLSHARHL